MRIKLNYPYGDHGTGDVIDVDRQTGVELVHYGRAVIPDPDITEAGASLRLARKTTARKPATTDNTTRVEE